MIPSTIRLGDRNTTVVQWQSLLGVPADGMFGPKTAAATRAWQLARGLTPDGIVGPMTWTVALAAQQDASSTTARVHGIDTSQVQGRPDFDAVKAAGFVFNVSKATEGNGFVDPRFRENVYATLDAGLEAGAYAFARPDLGELDPERECEFLFKACEGLGLTMWPTLDLESMGKLSAAQCYAWAGRWVARAEQLWGRCNVYVGKYFWQALGPSALQSDWAKRCNLWVPQYKKSVPYEPGTGELPAIMAPWSRASMWQYSGDHGLAVPGVKVACDRNLYLGSLAEFRAEMLMPK